MDEPKLRKRQRIWCFLPFWFFLMVDFHFKLFGLTTGRKVDLVEIGQLKSFATSSAEQDKILIYERKTKRLGEAKSYH